MIAFEKTGYWEGESALIFFFGFDDFLKGPQQDFIQTHLAQVAQNRLLEQSRTGFDEIPMGHDSLWKDWLLRGWTYPNFFFLAFMTF